METNLFYNIDPNKNINDNKKHVLFNQNTSTKKNKHITYISTGRVQASRRFSISSIPHRSSKRGSERCWTRSQSTKSSRLCAVTAL